MPSRHAADIRQVAQKTGRSLDEWCELLEANGVGERRDAVNMLRDPVRGEPCVRARHRGSVPPSLERRRRVGQQPLRRPRARTTAGSHDRRGERDRNEPRGGRGRPGRRFAFADHHCFACGEDEPDRDAASISSSAKGTARTEWLVGEDYVGWSDKAHGGIIATLLDEVMAWAPSSFDSWAVTAELSIRYRSPAAPGQTLPRCERARRAAPSPDLRRVLARSAARTTGWWPTGRGRYLGASPE